MRIVSDKIMNHSVAPQWDEGYEKFISEFPICNTAYSLYSSSCHQLKPDKSARIFLMTRDTKNDFLTLWANFHFSHTINL
jgi:hypothetical protein